MFDLIRLYLLLLKNLQFLLNQKIQKNHLYLKFEINHLYLLLRLNLQYLLILKILMNLKYH